MLQMTLGNDSYSYLSAGLVVALIAAGVVVGFKAWALLSNLRGFNWSQPTNGLRYLKVRPGVAAAGSLLHEGVMVGLTSFHFIIWLLVLSSAQHNQLSFPLAAMCVIASLILCRTLSFRRGQSRAMRIVSLNASVVQLVGLAMLGQLYPLAPADIVDPAAIPGKLVTKPTEYAVTDAGTRISLFERHLPKDEFDQYVVSIQPQIASIARTAMRRSKATMVSNCHGWVFAGGRHLIHNDDVPKILQDNGYSMQACPNKGDVVVYRNSLGQVIHTGIVCGFIGESKALIESKWGVEGCFVHLVDEQPYSQEYSFWRSSRPQHLLTMMHEEADGISIPVNIASLPGILSSSHDD